MSRVVLYTANYGGYDTPKVQPPLGVPAYLYTDDPNLRVEGWETRCYGLHEVPSSMLRAKWWKVRPDLAAPDAEISMWLDSSMTVKVNDYVDRCLAALGDDDFVLVKHPARSCVYDEAQFSMHLPKYNDGALLRQIDFYMRIGHPPGWGLFASGANVRRHTDAVVKMGKDWWYENANRTWQDQVSLPVLLRLAGDTIKWNTNMPWGQWWDIAEHLR